MSSGGKFIIWIVTLNVIVHDSIAVVRYRSYETEFLAEIIEDWQEKKENNYTQLKVMQRSDLGLSFIHIPKTGGTAMRHGLPKEYITLFSWGREFNEPKCNVKRASRFHLTQSEAVMCGVVSADYWYNHFVLCTVREPLDRAVSELKFNYKGDLNAYMRACEEARPNLMHDILAHCRSQTDYLYEDGKPVCDMIIANPSKHLRLLNVLNISNLNSKRKVNRSPDILLTNNTIESLERWIRTVHRSDFNDTLIAAAVRGSVLLSDTRKMHDQNADDILMLPNNPRHNFFRPYYRRPDEVGRQKRPLASTNEFPLPSTSTAKTRERETNVLPPRARGGRGRTNRGRTSRSGRGGAGRRQFPLRRHRADTFE
uniref:Sulfotransferase domain-containing protein n=1 Tax=Aureoumbra lagunensis TaxID=44058 RepID=A0A7S3K4W0_9STRA